MKKKVSLSNLHFHDSRIVKSVLFDNKVVITYERVLNLIDRSILPIVIIEFTGINILKIERDYGNDRIRGLETPVLQDFIKILETKPYIYEFTKLESKSNYNYEILLDTSMDDCLSKIYFESIDCKVDF